jgi:hypothetical protein
MVFLACASKTLWKSTPNMQQASNEYFVATISPIYSFNAYKGFLFGCDTVVSIKNKLYMGPD